MLRVVALLSKNFLNHSIKFNEKLLKAKINVKIIFFYDCLELIMFNGKIYYSLLLFRKYSSKYVRWIPWLLK